jgi:hypothetical protein
MLKLRIHFCFENQISEMQQFCPDTLYCFYHGTLPNYSKLDFPRTEFVFIEMSIKMTLQELLKIVGKYVYENQSHFLYLHANSNVLLTSAFVYAALYQNVAFVVSQSNFLDFPRIIYEDVQKRALVFVDAHPNCSLQALFAFVKGIITQSNPIQMKPKQYNWLKNIMRKLRERGLVAETKQHTVWIADEGKNLAALFSAEIMSGGSN